MLPPLSFAEVDCWRLQALTNASKLAILNANYMAKRLEAHYPVLFRGSRGTVAHEFIIDLRPIKASAGIEARCFPLPLRSGGTGSSLQVPAAP